MHEVDATALIQSTMPLCAMLGIQAQRYTREEVVLSLEWAPGLCTTSGLMHGGAIMALADSAGGACAMLNLPADASGTATIESHTNFLGGVRAGMVKATASPLHTGRTTIVVETSVRDSGGRLVARVTQTQMVLRARA